mmetsp:Transcript_11949/g.24013  ORF Transcript_11949/g.24013 Transcript_11949/m.24013 type:complete len:314 (-) Transcript_11949:953-1894(-)
MASSTEKQLQYAKPVGLPVLLSLKTRILCTPAIDLIRASSSPSGTSPSIFEILSDFVGTNGSTSSHPIHRSIPHEKHVSLFGALSERHDAHIQTRVGTTRAFILHSKLYSANSRVIFASLQYALCFQSDSIRAVAVSLPVINKNAASTAVSSSSPTTPPYLLFSSAMAIVPGTEENNASNSYNFTFFGMLVIRILRVGSDTTLSSCIVSGRPTLFLSVLLLNNTTHNGETHVSQLPHNTCDDDGHAVEYSKCTFSHSHHHSRGQYPGLPDASSSSSLETVPSQTTTGSRPCSTLPPSTYADTMTTLFFIYIRI